jgi:hypothetical protein
MSVVPYGYVTKTCPACHRFLDLNMFGMSSLLGPPTIICPSCGRHVDSGRGEWEDLDLASRLWFVVFSLISAAFVGILGGLTILFPVQVFQGRDLSRSFNLRREPAYITGVITWGIIVAVFQLYRIYCSSRRTAISDDIIPVRASFWTIEIGLQAKMLLLIVSALLSYGSGWLIWFLMR